MNKTLVYIAAILLLLTGSLLPAFSQKLPQISPKGVVKQTVGLTDITIEYNRPGVKGRKVWGNLVPYNQTWRTGANEATIIKFSDPVWINENKIEAGEYAIFTIPRPGSWTILINRNTRSWGTYDYREEDNVLAFKAKPYKDHFEETLTFEIVNITRNSAEVHLKWEKLVIPFTVRVEVEEKVNRTIDEAISSAGTDWSIYANCAEYCLRNNIRYEEASRWIEKAIELSRGNFRSLWLKADLLALKRDFKGAIEFARQSMQSGIAERGEKFTYKADLEKAISQWESKVN